MTESRWDAWRRDQRGKVGTIPTCSTCRGVSVLDPCRSCASTEQLALYPPETDAEFWSRQSPLGPPVRG